MNAFRVYNFRHGAHFCIGALVAVDKWQKYGERESFKPCIVVGNAASSQKFLETFFVRERKEFKNSYSLIIIFEMLKEGRGQMYNLIL